MDASSPDPGEKEFLRLSLRDDNDRLFNNGSCLKQNVYTI
jgi:hypothetical protein